MKHKWRHWSDVDMVWWRARWPNFLPSELACSHCGELMIDTEALDKLQYQRRTEGRAKTINSAYRCPIWNAMVGGAPLSQHKFAKAFDQRKDAPGAEMEASAIMAGFTGIGRYRTFIHTDTGRKRSWGKWA